ncbi:hypothetical protein L218DRAFT_991200 [Marasmius fiardii PR-910]|nr:hypothetical protein L218DRAFT_991200 [Marasmius fiardii PR-910]
MPEPTTTTSPFLKNRVRLLMFTQKKDDISFQEYSRYWSHEHAQIFMDLEIVKKNILKYEQLHVNQEWKAKLRENPSVNMPDFDGIVLFEAESPEKIQEVVQHPEFMDKVMGDAKKLFKLDSPIVRATCDIAVILDTSSKDTKPKPEVGNPVYQNYGRLIAPLRKNDSLSQTQFSDHWLNVHDPTFKSTLANVYSISKWEQLHIRPDPSGNTSEWSGIGVIEAASLAKIFDILQIEQFKKWVENNASFLSGNLPEMLPCDVITFIDK